MHFYKRFDRTHCRFNRARPLWRHTVARLLANIDSALISTAGNSELPMRRTHAEIKSHQCQNHIRNYLIVASGRSLRVASHLRQTVLKTLRGCNRKRIAPLPAAVIDFVLQGAEPRKGVKGSVPPAAITGQETAGMPRAPIGSPAEPHCHSIEHLG